MMWEDEMPLLRVNANGASPVPHQPGQTLDASLRDGLRHPGPVIIMVHGFKFSPFAPTACPHRRIFALSTYTDRLLSWPRALGFGQSKPDEGLCIAFGWAAQGWFWGANARASVTAVALAKLVSRIRRLDPTRPIHLIGHSLGGKVCLRALHHLPQHSVGRVIVLNAAVFRDQARAALQSRAGQTAEILNITTRENMLYDWTLKALLRPHLPISSPLRTGVRRARNMATIAIDRPTTRKRLRDLGITLDQDVKWMCHWSTYTRAGVWELYERALRTPETLPLHLLQEPHQDASIFTFDLPKLGPASS